MLWNRRKYGSVPRSWWSHTFLQSSKQLLLGSHVFGRNEIFLLYSYKICMCFIKDNTDFNQGNILQLLLICMFLIYFTSCVSKNNLELFILYTQRQWHCVSIVKEENWEIIWMCFLIIYIIVLKFTNTSGHNFLSINAIIKFINIIQYLFLYTYYMWSVYVFK